MRRLSGVMGGVGSAIIKLEMKVEPWCVEVSTVSTVSTECRGGVEGVSVDTSVDGVEGVNGVSKAILTSGML